MEKTVDLPQLTAEEQRVLGSLIEKSRTTPDYYPMTLNSITAACNQKSSRNPIVQYDQETITLAINSLKKRGFISTVTGGGSRTIKYKHNLAVVYPLVPAALSIVCILLLRGPQTPGEINNNSARLYEFESLEEVMDILKELAGGETPFVQQLPKRPGQKEQRFIHLFGQTFADETDESIYNVEDRIKLLEEEIAYLKLNLDKLTKEWLS